jgi:hypothetical protein
MPEIVGSELEGLADFQDPMWLNHQTHHRGQVHDQLSQTAVAPPPLDLIFYLRETGDQP